MSSAKNTGPRAFRLDGSVTLADPDNAATARTSGTLIHEQPDAFAAPLGQPEDSEAAIEAAQAEGMAPKWRLSFAGLFWSALSGLVSLMLGLWVTKLVDDLFAKSAVLGWIGLALAALAGLALIVMVAREIMGIASLRKVARLHRALAQAREADDGKAARPLLGQLVALYANRPETAAARATLQSLEGEIIDGRDLIDLAERTLIHPRDALVRREIALAARRVSVVTAISPRALIDVLFVAVQALRLVRVIAVTYGGRPGLFGFWKLARSVGAHLAITGGMAVGDSLVQQVLGHGLAAKLSARLGEGVLNGLLTARIGLSAMSVCRPMPFNAAPPPGVKDVAPDLFGGKGSKDSTQ